MRKPSNNVAWPRTLVLVAGLCGVGLALAAVAPALAGESAQHSAKYSIELGQDWSSGSPKCIDGFKAGIPEISYTATLGGPYSVSGPDKKENETLTINIFDASGSQVISKAVTLTAGKTHTDLGVAGKVPFKVDIQLAGSGNSKAWSLMIWASCPCVSGPC